MNYVLTEQARCSTIEGTIQLLHIIATCMLLLLFTMTLQGTYKTEKSSVLSVWTITLMSHEGMFTL